jgi:hypothetical protein
VRYDIYIYIYVCVCVCVYVIRRQRVNDSALEWTKADLVYWKPAPHKDLLPCTATVRSSRWLMFTCFFSNLFPSIS